MTRNRSSILALALALLAAPAAGQTAQTPAPTQAPALMARAGVTALSGRVLTADGKPLRDVVLADGPVRAMTDADGRFLLENVAQNESVLVIDGRASRVRQAASADYGYYEARVRAAPQVTTVLPFTSYLTKIDHRHDVAIASPTTAPITVTTPTIPGLELRLPAGVVLTDPDGKPVTRIGITKLPLDHTPFPLPANVYVPVYFTAQPGGAVIAAVDGSWKGAQVVYPNYRHELPKARGAFWRYDPDNLGWTIYGTGTVTADGKQVVPAPDTRIYALTGAMFDANKDGAPPPNGPAPDDSDPPGADPPDGDNPPSGNPNHAKPGDGDPIDLGTGLFVQTHTDLRLKDVQPLALTRAYRPGDYNKRSFGIGMTLSYELSLWSANQYQEVDLVLPDGGRVHYTRIPNNPPSNGNADAVFVTTSVSAFYQSHISWNGNGWNLVLQNGTTYVFGENAPLQYIQDRYGNRTALTRAGGNQNGNITQVTSPNGRFIRFAYDSTNTYITQATDNAGRTVGYAYDASGRLTTVTDPDGGVTTYSWDASNRVSAIQDAKQHTFVTNTYDANDRLLTQALADGSTYNFAYTLNASGGVAEADTTDPRGFVRKTTFDMAGHVLTDQFATGTSVEQDWSYVRQAGTELVLSRTDPLGRTTSWAYDANGKITSVTRLAGTANAASVQYTYASPFGALASIIDPLSHTTTIQRNGLGEATSIADPLGHQVTLTYDAQGQVTSVADPLGNQTKLTRDHGDLSAVTDPLGRVVQVFIDGVGRRLQTTDSLGNRTTTAYDPIKGAAQHTDAGGATTAIAYDAIGLVASVTDARNGVTTFAYDLRNHLTTRTDPLLAIDALTNYDGKGNLLAGTDRKGQTASYTYDPRGRRATAGYADGSTVAYTWDAGNRLTQVQDSAGGTIARAYDGFDRLTSETSPQGTVSYTYDAVGRRLSMTAAGQSTVSYSYDDASRLTQVAQGSAITSFTYDYANRRTATTLPNGITVAYTYDAASELTGITYSNGTTTVGTLTYAYDALGHVASRGGSLFQSVLPAAVTSASYDAANRLTQWVTPNGGTTPSWDANGNLASDGARSFTWDARNRLVGIAGGTSFTYDARGRRASTTLGGQTRSYLYDGVDPVAESVGSAISAGLLTGMGADERFTRTTAAGTATYVTDALGSTVALADGNGTVQTAYGYDPYGNGSATGAASDNSYQYTGRENDGTGLYYYRARYYNPAWGRFVSEDPIGLRGGINRYRYANGNPVSLRDPDGQFGVVGVLIGAVSGGIGGYITGGYAGAIGGAFAGGIVGAVAPTLSAYVGGTAGSVIAGAAAGGFGAAIGNLFSGKPVMDDVPLSMAIGAAAPLLSGEAAIAGIAGEFGGLAGGLADGLAGLTGGVGVLGAMLDRHLNSGSSDSPDSPDSPDSSSPPTSGSPDNAAPSYDPTDGALFPALYG